jgi:hypothetical protein
VWRAAEVKQDKPARNQQEAGYNACAQDQADAPVEAV